MKKIFDINGIELKHGQKVRYHLGAYWYIANVIIKNNEIFFTSTEKRQIFLLSKYSNIIESIKVLNNSKKKVGRYYHWEFRCKSRKDNAPTKNSSKKKLEKTRNDLFHEYLKTRDKELPLINFLVAKIMELESCK